MLILIGFFYKLSILKQSDIILWLNMYVYVKYIYICSVSSVELNKIILFSIISNILLLFQNFHQILKCSTKRTSALEMFLHQKHAHSCYDLKRSATLTFKTEQFSSAYVELRFFVLVSTISVLRINYNLNIILNSMCNLQQYNPQIKVK